VPDLKEYMKRKIYISELEIVIDEERQTNIVALMNDIIVGTVSLKYKGQRSAAIFMLFVKEDWRNIGIGSLLVKRCCELSKENGNETIGLLVTKDNIDVESFYNKSGFKFVYEYDNKSLLLSKELI
jgi:ribosomal protein S18 acetylase RimI-like enzyme